MHVAGHHRNDVARWQHHDERFSGPLGLDGRFGISAPTRYGIDAVKARWLSDHVLSISRRILGNGATARLLLDFEGRGLDLHLTSTDGFAAELHGERTD